MKKRSLTYILILVIVGVILGLVITMCFEFLSKQSSNSTNYRGLSIMAVWPGLFIGISISLVIFKRIIWSSQRKKHEGVFPAIGFIPQYAFYSDNCAFYFDLSNGKIAVTTIFNPFKLQMVNIAKVEKAWVSIGNMLGGTRMVCFCLMIEKTTWRIPTFTANVSYSLHSNPVTKAIDKAQRMVEYILVTKKSVNNNGKI